MFFLVRAALVVGVIAFLSPYRGGAERETARLASEAPARALAALPEAGRERVIAEGMALAGATLAAGAAGGALRGALPEENPREPKPAPH